MTRITIEEHAIARFWRHVRKSAGCWEWTGSRHSYGYGWIHYRRKTQTAHRFSYWLHHGENPTGMDIHHLCNNPPCVNPTHLLALTHKEHLSRYTVMGNAKKTHCKRGHPFDDSNTIRHKDGRRECRVCTRVNGRLKMRRYRTESRLGLR